jgi:hypothetical protein
MVETFMVSLLFNVNNVLTDETIRVEDGIILLENTL